jgi:glycosyltransferase involved in cell wall biosynthesis
MHTHTAEDSESANDIMNLQNLVVFILCKTFLRGGAEKQAIMLAYLFSAKGYDVTLINWSGKKIDPDNKKFIDNNSIKYLGLQGGSIRKYRLLVKRIGKHQNTVIFAYLTLANVISGFLRLSKREIITIGGVRSEYLPPLKFFFERIIHNHLNTFTIFNSYSAKEKFQKKGFDPDKMKVIHNAIRIPRFNKISRSSGMITIVSVSRFVKSKDYHTALHAYKKLVDNTPNKKLKYKIIGYGNCEAAIRMMIKSLDLVNSVEVLIQPENIHNILREADIYLSTSIYEGLSNSIMEAMTAGLPVVTTDVGDNKYLIQEDFNGYLVKTKDVDTIANKLQYLVENEETRRKFSQNGYNKILSDFSEEKLFKNYITLLSDLV